VSFNLYFAQRTS